jgi:hypothetical protein
MIAPRRAPTLLFALALASACGGSTGTTQADAKATKADAKATKATDAKATDAKAPAGPHAGANPHGGMPPMMGTPPAPKGPPRDVTPSGETVPQTLPGLAFAVPKEWEQGTPTNAMRVAQWVLPGPGGDAELVVFRFAGGGGGIEANVARWKGQFQAPEGKTIDDVTTTKTLEAGGLKTTLVDVTGTYVAAVTPGAEQQHDDADQRMIAAIVEGSGDPFYFKALGPRATMDLWAPAFEAMASGLSSGDAKPPEPAPPEGDAKAPPEPTPPPGDAKKAAEG